MQGARKYWSPSWSTPNVLMNRAPNEGAVRAPQETRPRQASISAVRPRGSCQLLMTSIRSTVDMRMTAFRHGPGSLPRLVHRLDLFHFFL